jgi:hypothetical protein
VIREQCPVIPRTTTYWVTDFIGSLQEKFSPATSHLLPATKRGGSALTGHESRVTIHALNCHVRFSMPRVDFGFCRVLA